ncbi:Hsp20/alpha crystallin family protein [Orientia tsutsugamushi]|uniref:18 kDa heat shock protein n=1 Tax=Orientia tsutsugamushi TaxID=784 RepID=A0A2U3RM00_ORITS|nr:Hsp20/alpha crystallin family protein [Orientia tsutsugamushi]KJV55681.1 hsp20/alpha crystallin family protein [Orientia tsutsugamushi str. Karp]SPR14197.1 18 kDa heat shock protein [Orientia tsutsugamushi]
MSFLIRRNKVNNHSNTLRQDLNNVLSDFLNNFSSFQSSLFDEDRALLPRIDVFETDTEYHLEVELPGIKQEDVVLKIDNNILTVEGHKDDQLEEKEKFYYMRERYYGSFKRSISLPSNIDENNIDAKFSDGMLCIKISKREQDKARKIEIKG